MQTAHFSRNPRGRDFVVGDLHGLFWLLEEALSEVAFDPRCDRLFSVGDLIDRGSESPRVVEFLAQPWFHACLGNHETVLLDYMARPSSAQLMLVWLQNGGGWFFKQDVKAQRRIAQAIERYMAWAIEVDTEAGLVGIVHADLPDPCHWPDFFRALPDDPQLQRLATWGRRRAYGEVSGTVTGVSRVFLGHTIMPAPIQVDNLYFIDTGAFRLERSRTHGALTLAQFQPTLALHEFRPA